MGAAPTPALVEALRLAHAKAQDIILWPIPQDAHRGHRRGKNDSRGKR